ncbi:RNA 3'-terminal phosphate cyclase [Streptomyces sp. MB09-02B]|uniref:RNA 3'-terminal phosphate cyclase n=1 Tax=Streptomyces sp. MB09-02B TaxID=3028667 RepID=UPI0029A65ACB|nr:RNA 3'-terminal phosphate cyclase [Streptomyces sp. MB09-02B]MDX3639700.1 RNA 3'-terminal phosphate cyclase [Streptomyces sp. MB09-02B]
MLTIDAAAGGGGLLRTALPLSVALGVPVRLRNVRVTAPERGLAWPHVRLVEGLCGWTDSDAGDVRAGDTDLIFRPGGIRPVGNLRIDLDDPPRTFEHRDITLRRDYSGAKDVFPGGLPDVGGRSVRGYSVCAPLIALLPLLPLMGPRATVTVRGGTETGGAPFADAVRYALLPALAAQFKVGLAMSVDQRGCIGIGGGEVTAAAEPAPVVLPTTPTCAGTTAFLYLFGAVRGNVPSRWRDGVRPWLPGPLRTEVVHVAYPVPRIQQLFLLGGGWPRDVSVCAEEGLPLAAPEVRERVLAEHRNTGHVSRFLLEQMLLWAAVRGERACWTTEHWTDHLRSVALVIRVLSGRTVITRRFSDTVEVTLD